MKTLSDTLQIFSTCPQSIDHTPETYLEQVTQVARWSEEAGCAGILVYTDNSLIDPWSVAQVIIQNTEHLAPLIAIQPIYMHPYWVAKKIATFAFLHQRRVYLNMLAGGFKLDLEALGDTTEHDDRYARTTEYTLILKRLVEGKAPVEFEGTYYTVRHLSMMPPVPEALQPGILISGSSDAGMEAAVNIGATAIKYPAPANEEQHAEHDRALESGIRIGIIARETADEAWQIANERFPEDRKGQLTHQMAMKMSDSLWHHQLSEMGKRPPSELNPYWLGPFKNYKTFCPYLVGSYERVAAELSRYIALDYRTFILDIPPCQEDLEHTRIVFEKAQQLTA